MKESGILFINQSSGYLMIDIINAFDDSFGEKVLAAGFLNPRNNPLQEQVRVEKLIPYDRTSTLRRIWTWSVAFIQLLWLIWTRYRGYHLFIVSNPPFATFLPFFTKNSFSILIYDIYPDALVEYKVFKRESTIVQTWEKLNQKIYARAKAVFTISDGMRDRLATYLSVERISVVPIWTDGEFLKPIPKAENEFRKAQGISDYFVLMYSGNLGKSHELGVLVDLAEKLRDDQVFVMLIGGGDQYEYLGQRIAESGLDNIRLLPWQPTELLPQTLTAADIGVVSLGKEASSLSMPSKTFNLLSAGCPIMAIAEPDASLSELVNKYQVGCSVKASELTEMVAFVKELAAHKKRHQEMSDRAVETAKLFGPDNAEKFVVVLSQHN